ncbi:hypothetical protein A4X09_0g813 [Tilletia walkeri]|uniref:SET domain-containing protein n=1 Tax=Tilletia walkeri TaxID=117179 RepID=A0A8X7T7P2_9BASI|nr:hypothetical protein A4X09_0g813 [Tilletia walkeri]
MVLADVSRGLEPVKVPVQDVTEEDLHALLNTFTQYRSQCIFHPSYIEHLADLVHRNRSEFQLDALEDLLDVSAYGCDCSRSASDADSGGESDTKVHFCSQSSTTCECVAEHGNFFELCDGPDGETQLLSLDAVPLRHVLYECTELCKCHRSSQTGDTDGAGQPKCANARVRSGVRIPLIVKPAQAEQGLGVFAAAPIRRGTFVCEYAGELISSSEAQRRWTEQAATGQGNYILSVKEQAYKSGGSAGSHMSDDAESASSSSADRVEVRIDIDPTYCGNVARFINHLCPPLTNLVIYPVRCDGPLVLVTSRFEGLQRRLGLVRLIDYLKVRGSQGAKQSTSDGSITALAVLPAPPRAALYASRDIKAGEQLGFDYYDASGTSITAVRPIQASTPRTSTSDGTAGSNVQEGEAARTRPATLDGRTRCLCDSPACRGSLPSEHDLMVG